MRTSELLREQAQGMRQMADEHEGEGGSAHEIAFMREVAGDLDELSGSLEIDLDLDNPLLRPLPLPDFSDLMEEKFDDQEFAKLERLLAEAYEEGDAEGARLLERMKARLLARKRTVIFDEEEA